ncbi:hypothetical protein HDU79_006101 [Rhizoclosmatium sp. JEL0117]|nr:hypothetical protein HDU79_006101 [Rhizoclosmatium sp. JEL0117]
MTSIEQRQTSFNAQSLPVSAPASSDMFQQAPPTRTESLDPFFQSQFFMTDTHPLLVQGGSINAVNSVSSHSNSNSNSSNGMPVHPVATHSLLQPVFSSFNDLINSPPYPAPASFSDDLMFVNNQQFSQGYDLMQNYAHSQSATTPYLFPAQTSSQSNLMNPLFAGPNSSTTTTPFTPKYSHFFAVPDPLWSPSSSHNQQSPLTPLRNNSFSFPTHLPVATPAQSPTHDLSPPLSPQPPLMKPLTSTTSPVAAPQHQASFSKPPRFKPNDAELALLQGVFSRNPYPNATIRKKLAEKLGLELKQIQFWFQNRRALSKSNGNQLCKPKKGSMGAAVANAIELELDLVVSNAAGTAGTVKVEKC